MSCLLNFKKRRRRLETAILNNISRDLLYVVNSLFIFLIVQILGRTLKSSIAVDNGRSTEFIRRRDYPDKSLCYECGQEGHLSYCCTNNTLGPREPPAKKVRIRKKNVKQENYDTSYFDSDSDEATRKPKRKINDVDNDDDDTGEEPETLSAVIALEVSS